MANSIPLPTVPEDTLHYTIHLPPSEEPLTATLLVSQHVHSLLPERWLWNKDPWELKVATDGDHKLEGRMRVGDAVDDEWLVVWLLTQVSKKWPEFIISIRDTDGEFLLIEAANELPSWVSPDNANNRLWLSNGHLHLLPLSVHSPSPPHQLPDDLSFDSSIYLSETDALRAVQTGKYLAPKEVESAVWERLKSYPEAMKTHLHQAKVYLPVGIAKSLNQKPELVQKAVEAFYVRDPAQLRAASRMTHFSPSPSILSQVTLTRAAYAQLQGQVFHPPRVFGPEWNVRDSLSSVVGEGTPGNLENERRWRDLGVKLATGFEIMYREGGRKSRSGATGESLDRAEDEEYAVFLEGIRKAGWFGNEVEGSQKWKEREEEARKGYVNAKSVDIASQRPSFAYLVDNAIASCSLSLDQLAVSENAPEDNDDWLQISPDELDSMMLHASGQAKRSNKQDEGQGKKEDVELTEEDGKALGDLAKKVQEFVGGQGDLQGARFVDELSDEDMDSGSDFDDEELQAHKGKLEAEKQARMDSLVPTLPASDWGRKVHPSEQSHQSPVATNQLVGSSNADAKKIDPLEFIPSKMRPPRFAKQEFDGVVSDSESDSESDLPVEDSEDNQQARIEEIEEEDEDDQQRKAKLRLGEDVDLEEEMQRRVWGGGKEDGDEDEDMAAEGEEELDVDMEDEAEEFLKFSREALGINDEMWEGILGDRRARGAFVPQLSGKTKPKDELPVKLQPQSSTSKRVQFAEAKVPSKSDLQPSSSLQSADQLNTSLDSFETVMRAMDEALARSRSEPSTSQPCQSKLFNKSNKKSTSSANPLPLISQTDDVGLDAFSEDDIAAMDRELRSVLKGAGIDPDDSDDDIEEVGELDLDQKREYEMMRNFLESFKSQGGESGVVGNLFGRLSEKH
ncbi:hypothetical protein I307_00147 [Cryptococcus deuterogattii 99/473]|uniref:Unplaced genomic scaffold supercont1.1, whole genome shotgun sequence n=1 Tax=Cryptococcus deuterogattii Ram5 TaxID=1296110 RepID=A0A0D0V8H2_9TREE|nr:hypothetical protein I313_00656 [Cryptococcus deuterogattii Ram5]KIR75143.1 hypothetical protein I310_01420 [Cryptococcus deuterogattii CA1014]KIY60347.1 hypothetical protein I307_00147 [Cryptococcus deuterogattii 99/473]